MLNFDYNTQLEPLIQKEYGRNVQKLAGFLLTIEDRDKRTRLANALIELMREIHPNMREGQDYTMKLWDDLYILTGFDLDVDSPYPPPEKSSLGKKPQTVPYNTHEFKHKHYGHQTVKLIEQASAMTDPDEQLRAMIYIGRLMKSFGQTWTDKNTEDETIVQQLREISKGKLNLDLQLVKSENLFDLESFRRPETGRETSREPRENRGERNGNGGRDNNRSRSTLSTLDKGIKKERNDRGRNQNRNTGRKKGAK